ncbi:MAG: type II CRISPR RNA-guided endonuclease Cas9 [Muribaculaceae bacterium]|nr:type II CRISPR RNA-guided endonuclease Cas9 [Muribaculaceae bacterium]
MKKILGLDLGTSSIGWAMVNQAENELEKSAILKMGVRINPLSVDEKSDFEKGKSITTTAERTLKRGIRRNLQRFKLRRNKLLQILYSHHIINENFKVSEDGTDSTYETLQLRAKAVHESITLEQFARILLSLNKKRGYKSNRKANNEDDGELIDSIQIAQELNSRNITPGEYVHELIEHGKRFIPQFYKSDLQNEFDTIWNLQSQFYPSVLDNNTYRKVICKNRKDTSKLFFAAHSIEAAEEKDRKVRQSTYYNWRATAAKSRIELSQLVTVFCEINADISSSSGYLSAIGDHSKELGIKKMTVGEYLWSLVQSNPMQSLKNIVFYRNDYLNEFQTIWDTQSRFHPELTKELKDIIRNEIVFYQRRLKSQKGLISFCELEAKEIVLPNKRTILTGPRACPKSSPLYQEFKIWQDLNNLIIENKSIKVNSKRSRKRLTAQSLFELEPETEKYSPLSLEQKETLFKELSCCKEMSAKEVLRTIGLNEKEYSLNFKRMQGNTTQTILFDAYKKIIDMSGHDIEKFDKMNSNDKIAIIEQIFSLLGAKTDFLFFDAGQDNDKMQQNAMFKLWHLLYSYEDDNSDTGNESLINHIMELTNLPREFANEIARVTFVYDYGSLSSKAIRNILHFMRAGKGYSEACEMAGYKHSKHSLTVEENEKRELQKHLDILPRNSLRNPVVEKIINQMIHIVNGCIEEFGEIDEIHVEMARSLKQNQKQRQNTTKIIGERTKEAERIENILRDAPFNISKPSRNDVLRYRLYEELAPNGFKTLYSDTYISRERLFSRDFDIEHIIPQSRLFDDSYSNKTIEARDVNIEKSNMTAIDYVGWKYGEEGIKNFMRRINFIKEANPKKYNHLITTESQITSDFLNRELTDTQYIAKKATELLLQVTRTVVPTTGAITARMRKDWQLVDVMKELNWDKYEKLGLTTTERNRDGHEVRHIVDWTKRNDHRHHAMDALTIAFTQRSHIQYLNNLNAKDNDEKKDSCIYGIERKVMLDGRHFIPPMPLNELRNEAKRHLESILVSIKAKSKVGTLNINKIKGSMPQSTITPRGQLHNETVYGKRNRYTTKLESVGSRFDEQKIATVCSKVYRNALLKRLIAFGGDPRKAFTGKNSLSKSPLFLSGNSGEIVPSKVKTVVIETIFTIRKPINKDLKVDKVVDEGIKQILKKRISEFGGDQAKAFSNLDDNPIWLNQEKGIAIKNVSIKGVNVATPLRMKKDKDGNIIVDDTGNPVPNDYVSTSNNHHIAIFEDSDGNLQEHVVSFLEAVARKNLLLPIVDKDYNRTVGWRFLFTMKQNEYFIFPDEATGFNPLEIDLTDPQNYSLISPHLFRVQKLSTCYYVFRHHLETTVDDKKELQNINWIRITSINKLRGIIKVCINHLGQIVKVGEYR